MKKFKSAYSKKSRVFTPVVGVSMTKQSEKEKCDINKIMLQYNKTGLVTHIAKNRPQYQDLLGLGSYHDIMNQLIAAQDAFDSLPAKVRARFKNDPGELFDFVAKEENYDEAVQLGLIDLDVAEKRAKKRSTTQQTRASAAASGSQPGDEGEKKSATAKGGSSTAA